MLIRTYTAEGLPAGLTDARGNATAFAYDRSDRLATTYDAIPIRTESILWVAMMKQNTAEVFSKEVDVVLRDGSHLTVKLSAEERWENDIDLYRVEVVRGDEVKVGESEDGFFDALCNVRRELERDGMLLCCFGASENVYPSGMQVSMGPALLAYKNHLGKQAFSKDIVNIFDSDETVRPSTVEQQKSFHERWFRSL